MYEKGHIMFSKRIALLQNRLFNSTNDFSSIRYNLLYDKSLTFFIDMILVSWLFDNRIGIIIFCVIKYEQTSHLMEAGHRRTWTFATPEELHVRCSSFNIFILFLSNIATYSNLVLLKVTLRFQSNFSCLNVCLFPNFNNCKVVRESKEFKLFMFIRHCLRKF